jgi:hypothetical protein
MSCNRCGVCCSWVAISKRGKPMQYITYMRERGVREDGDFLLIYSPCQHLINSCEGAVCDVHGTNKQPPVCKMWNGEKRIGEWTFWVPSTCTNRKNDKGIE